MSRPLVASRGGVESDMLHRDDSEKDLVKDPLIGPISPPYGPIAFLGLNTALKIIIFIQRPNEEPSNHCVGLAVHLLNASKGWPQYYRLIGSTGTGKSEVKSIDH